MSLSDQQYKFSKDIIQLLVFALAKGWKFTFGEAERPEEMQKLYLEEEKTTVRHSLHQDRLAIDINFFKPVKNKHSSLTGFAYTTNKKDLQEIGDFWESLDNRNEWGGNWESFLDTPHFQRNKN